MCKTLAKLLKAAVAAVVAVACIVGFSAQAQVASVTCPPNAQATTVGFGLIATRTNGTIVQPGQSIGAYETVNILGTVFYQPQVLAFVNGHPQIITTSAFYGGTGTILANNGNPGSPFDVTPPDMATFRVGPADPGLCADGALKAMNNLPYTPTAADISAGSVTFTFNYTGGHSLLGDCSLLVSASAQFMLQVVGLPSCSIAPASQTIYAGAEVSFTASSIGPAGGAPFTFTWTGPNGFTATGATITITNAQTAAAGTYTATVIDQFGCTSTCTAALIVNPTNSSPVLSAQVSNTTLLLTIQNVGGFNYTVQQATNLSTTNWITFTNFIGVGSLTQFTKPTTGPAQLFFRISQP